MYNEAVDGQSYRILSTHYLLLLKNERGLKMVQSR